MEYLSFNKSGQWELHKAEPKSDYKPGNKPFKVFNGAALSGDLHEDRGNKGTLHNFGGGSRPKNQTNWQNVGKPSKDNQSVYTERNPGVGD